MAAACVVGMFYYRVWYNNIIRYVIRVEGNVLQVVYSLLCLIFHTHFALSWISWAIQDCVYGVQKAMYYTNKWTTRIVFHVHVVCKLRLYCIMCARQTCRKRCIPRIKGTFYCIYLWCKNMFVIYMRCQTIPAAGFQCKQWDNLCKNWDKMEKIRGILEWTIPVTPSLCVLDIWGGDIRLFRSWDSSQISNADLSLPPAPPPHSTPSTWHACLSCMVLKW